MSTDLPRGLTQRISDATNVFPAGSSPLSRRAAEALRRLAGAAVDPHLGLTAETVRTLEMLADQRPREHPTTRFADATTRHDGLATFPMGTHPILGLGNPFAVPIEIDLIGDMLVGWARYGPLHEGLPGSVFGGFVAAGFDALLGIRAALVGTPCSAASLTTNFRAPTPLHVEVRYEVELERVERRKILVRGRVLDDTATVTATSEALFVAVPTDVVSTELPPHTTKTAP